MPLLTNQQVAWLKFALVSKVVGSNPAISEFVLFRKFRYFDCLVNPQIKAKNCLSVPSLSDISKFPLILHQIRMIQVLKFKVYFYGQISQNISRHIIISYSLYTLQSPAADTKFISKSQFKSHSWIKPTLINFIPVFSALFYQFNFI
jgi:hypothetical protein